MIAILILSIGTLAAFRVSDTAQRSLGQQEARLIAQQVALNRAADLKLLGMKDGRNLPAALEMGRLRWGIEVIEKTTEVGIIEATIIVTGQNSAGARLVTFVPTDEIK